MREGGRHIAIGWGTANRRAHATGNDGAVRNTMRGDRAALAGFPLAHQRPFPDRDETGRDPAGRLHHGVRGLRGTHRRGGVAEAVRRVERATHFPGASRAALPGTTRMFARGGITPDSMARWRAAGADGVGCNPYRASGRTTTLAADARRFVSTVKDLA